LTLTRPLVALKGVTKRYGTGTLALELTASPKILSMGSAIL
jgi:hypothetical protein